MEMLMPKAMTVIGREIDVEIIHMNQWRTMLAYSSIMFKKYKVQLNKHTALLTECWGGWILESHAEGHT